MLQAMLTIGLLAGIQATLPGECLVLSKALVFEKPGTGFVLCFSLTVWPWESYLDSLGLDFLVGKTELVLVPISQVVRRMEPSVQVECLL